MRKFLIAVLVIFGFAPYTVMLTEVKTIAETSETFNCLVSKPRRAKRLFGVSVVNYSLLAEHERQILVPQFFVDHDVFDAECRNGKFVIGNASWLKVGERITVWTETRSLSIMGIELFRKRGITMIGSGWNNDPNEEDRD